MRVIGNNEDDVKDKEVIGNYGSEW